MSLTPGLSLQSLRLRSPNTAASFSTLKNLCTSFAGFLLASWSSAHLTPQCTPSTEHQNQNSLVGTTLPSRLRLLAQNLPPRFLPLATHLLSNLSSVISLPWVLTHGDLLPGNFMLNLSTGHLTGLVDWAESEVLPFGLCFYGLEEILGEVTESGFAYHPQSDVLRAIFWEEMERGIPGLKHGGGGNGGGAREKWSLRERIRMSRDLGVLLWFGIAFDDGAIDRVVQEGRDIVEIWKLDAFLGGGDASERLTNREIERGT
jgi:hypothetical protein